MKIQTTIHPDLLIAQKILYEPVDLTCKSVAQEAESQEYGACTFEINKKNIKFRVSKITPTKIGQFVTIWKRIGDEPIMPFDMNDPVSLFIVSVRSGEKLGQFIFPKTILQKKGFISQNRKGGKRAMRVYPSWDIPESKQAQTTQEWQLKFFFQILPKSTVESSILKQLFDV